MWVGSVENSSNKMDYQARTAKASEEERIFPLEIQEEAVEVQEETGEESTGRSEEAPACFAGMSVDEFISRLMNGRKGNQIPVVNQIVSSKNPEDEKIYVTFFTDNKITCNHADGNRAWELDVSDENREKVKDYFKEFTPDKWAKEFYSGNDMGMAAVKDFWIELFKNDAASIG